MLAGTTRRSTKYPSKRRRSVDESAELRDELRLLRERVEAIERRLAMPPQRSVEPVQPPPQPLSEPLAPPVVPPPRPRRPEFETRVGLTWINRIGVVTLLLGAGFFFKYAVENDWIGPVARILLGIAAGLGALAAGDQLHRRNQSLFAQGISGLGIALLYLSVYAAYEPYHLIPNVLAFAALVLVTAAGAALAIYYDAIPVAALGSFGGYLTPVLVRPATWALYSYLLLLNVVAMALSRTRGWKALEYLALASTVLLYAISFDAKESLLCTLFLAAYYALFVYAGTAPVRMAAQVLAAFGLGALWPQQVSVFLLCSLALAVAGLVWVRSDVALGAFWLGYLVWGTENIRNAGPAFVAITLVFLLFCGWTIVRERRAAVLAVNGPVYFAAAFGLLDVQHHAWMGLLALGLAAIHLAAARQLFEVDPRAALLALGLGAGFVTIAIPVQFAGYSVTIAWAMEAAALAWIARRYQQPRAIWFSLGILLFILIRLLAVERELPVTYVVLNARFVTFTIAAVAFWLVAKWMTDERPALAVYIMGHALMLWALGMEIDAWARRTSAPADVESVITAGISIMLAAYAVILIGAGVLTSTTVNRILGLALIGIVIVKLYLYDVWLLGRLYRTVAFVALGALLVLSSYVYSRYRDRIETWWRERA